MPSHASRPPPVCPTSDQVFSSHCAHICPWEVKDVIRPTRLSNCVESCKSTSWLHFASAHAVAPLRRQPPLQLCDGCVCVCARCRQDARVSLLEPGLQALAAVRGFEFVFDKVVRTPGFGCMVSMQQRGRFRTTWQVQRCGGTWALGAPAGPSRAFQRRKRRRCKGPRAAADCGTTGDSESRSMNPFCCVMPLSLAGERGVPAFWQKPPGASCSWVPAGRLRPGEHLCTAQGRAQRG